MLNLVLVSALLLQNIRLVQLLTKELAEEGYAGVEVRVTPLRTEIIISATRPQNVLGEKGQRIRELTSVVQKRCVVPAACSSILLSRCPSLIMPSCLHQTPGLLSGCYWKMVHTVPTRGDGMT